MLFTFFNRMGLITEIIVVVFIVCAALGYCQSVRAKENPQEVASDTETDVKRKRS